MPPSSNAHDRRGTSARACAGGRAVARPRGPPCWQRGAAPQQHGAAAGEGPPRWGPRMRQGPAVMRRRVPAHRGRSHRPVPPARRPLRMQLRRRRAPGARRAPSPGPISQAKDQHSHPGTCHWHSMHQRQRSETNAFSASPSAASERSRFPWTTEVAHVESMARLSVAINSGLTTNEAPIRANRAAHPADATLRAKARAAARESPAACEPAPNAQAPPQTHALPLAPPPARAVSPLPGCLGTAAPRKPAAALWRT